MNTENKILENKYTRFSSDLFNHASVTAPNFVFVYSHREIIRQPQLLKTAYSESIVVNFSYRHIETRV